MKLVAEYNDGFGRYDVHAERGDQASGVLYHLCMDVCGSYYLEVDFAPRGGLMASYLLHGLAKLLDEINKPWDNFIADHQLHYHSQPFLPFHDFDPRPQPVPRQTVTVHC